MVVQTGARRGYALPRMLESAGCLHSFHTTAALRGSNELLAAYLRKITPGWSAAINRRIVRGIPHHKLYANPSCDIARILTVRKSGSSLKGRLAQSRELGRRTIPRIDGEANVAFIVDDSGGPDLMRALRAEDIPIGVDVVVNPMAQELSAAAAQDWPHWRANVFNLKERKRYLQIYEEVCELADLIMYQSEGVLEGLRQINGFDESKSRHVPYAMGTIKPLSPETERGRVFFAGSDPVRKGLPYLAAAAKILRAEGYDYRFVVAGSIPKQIQRLDDCSNLEFLGHISRDEMARQMACADVFCLPSLAEGTAAVALEALACGLPCIVTRSAGAPVTDGRNGRIVKERDYQHLASALIEVIEDRNARASMSQHALANRSAFEPQKVSAKLVEALASIVGNGAS